VGLGVSILLLRMVWIVGRNYVGVSIKNIEADSNTGEFCLGGRRHSTSQC